MVNAMPTSEFLRFSRSAKMLFAQQQLSNIEAASFHAFSKDDDRNKTMRNLKSQSERWLWQPVKDFKDVAANFAKALNRGG